MIFTAMLRARPSSFLHSQTGCLVLTRCISYVQGQSPAPKVREYFYYIDHQGQLFLDDTKIKNFVTCFKDKQFLRFFFRRLKINKTGRFDDEFPYISPCGVEKNYIRCEDLPIVFHKLETSQDNTSFSVLKCNGVEDGMDVEFQPSKICMLPESGRVYHPGPEKAGGIGLIKSSLAISLSSYFEYKAGSSDEDPPSHFNWNGELHELDNSLWDLIRSDEIASLQKRLGVK
ncbi:predicted protein [Nematostella vectensis]|uniref:Uncharacterized protein n=1 Tax=Nematostella vectensis TaxID=45351 RepID=A7SV11_NEMVE|nr:UPF0598 protein CG30010 [Nematostella vectensis]EDO32465.1 predicted protein [Nematostella vectensis]|eukprot:XP_001624565.1 predicted protein [Nematostella vectensis]